MIIGMLGFGVIADQLGRKTGAVATTLLLVLGIVLSTAASGTSIRGMFWMLIIARGIAGVGAGGEYPVSGAGATEATDESKTLRKHRGFMFAMIADLSASLGYVFGGLVPLLLLLCVHQKQQHFDIVWRLSFALGLIPPVSIFWFRYRMAVSTAFRKASMKKQRTPYLLAVKRYWRPMIGTSMTWFLYNWISIPFGIFASTITTRVNAGDSLITNLGWGVVINCFYIPGPFIGGYLSDKIGRRRTMALGFALQAVLGFVLGGANKKIQSVFPLFVVLYGIFLTLGEVGPGRYVPSPKIAIDRLTRVQYGCSYFFRMLPNGDSRSNDGLLFCCFQGWCSHIHHSLYDHRKECWRWRDIYDWCCFCSSWSPHRLLCYT